MELYQDRSASISTSPYDPPPIALHDFISRDLKSACSTLDGSLHPAFPLVDREDTSSSRLDQVCDGKHFRYIARDLLSRPVPSSVAQEEASVRLELQIQSSRVKLAGDENETGRDYDLVDEIIPSSTPQSVAALADISPTQPDWRTIRRRVITGKKGTTADWICGWSGEVSECGDSAYCACSDTPLGPQTIQADSALDERGKKVFYSRLIRKRILASGRDIDGTGGANHSISPPKRQAANKEGTWTRENQKGVDNTSVPEDPESSNLHTQILLCRNCARPAFQELPPDDADDFVWKKRAGIGERARNLVIQMFGGQNKEARPSPSLRQNTATTKAGLVTAVHNQVDKSGSAGLDGAYSDEDDEDDLDLDKLSRSTHGGRVAERQARLRRAQRLLQRSHFDIGYRPG
ncbi:hypothetical protein VTK73DRAFT_8897 [Phialemonium thermophilum]|uniref:Uncharacterized protein n=1 Tax=Phialemonium thermophilum TaxID=223376 RepID=A0ABR3XM77_9PEZI